jgi:hypothetical protein
MIKAMRVRWGRGRWHSRVVAGTIVYLIFLVTTPFEHDDLASHLKDPTHCTACMSSPVGSSPETPVILGAWTLPDAGRALTFHAALDGVLLPVRSTGRSPPATA